MTDLMTNIVQKQLSLNGYRCELSQRGYHNFISDIPLKVGDLVYIYRVPYSNEEVYFCPTIIKETTVTRWGNIFCFEESKLELSSLLSSVVNKHFQFGFYVLSVDKMRELFRLTKPEECENITLTKEDTIHGNCNLYN